MKRVLCLIPFLVSLFFSSAAFANQLPDHMSGIGVFTFKSSVDPSSSAKAAKAYAKEMHDRGIDYVIIKSHDGDSWGTIVGGKWEPAISKELVDAFHAEDIRVYSYFTARFAHANSVPGSIKLAVRTLDMGVDGVVVDDLGWLGGTTAQWDTLFSELRKEVNKRKGTILAFSSFPHFVQWEKSPWHVALKYSDYFLPQEYWHLFKAGKGRMTPPNALVYGQSQFDILKTRHPEYAKCELVPIGMSYSRKGHYTVTLEQLKDFLEAALPHYHGVGLFTYEQMPKGGWKVIKALSKKFPHDHPITKISTFDQFNNPPEVSPTPKGKEKSEGAKPSKTKPDKKKDHASPAPAPKPAPAPEQSQGSTKRVKIHY